MAHRRTWIVIAGAVVALLLLLVLVIPYFLNADNYRPRIEHALSDATGRPVTLGHLAFSLFTGSLSAQQLTIADDPAFSTQPFLQSQQIHIGVEVMPLLLSRQIKIQSITIDAPHIALITNQAGVANYASLGNANKRTHAQETQSTLPDLSIGRLQVTDGEVTVSTLGSNIPPRVFRSVQADIGGFSLTTPFTYSLSAALPGNGKMSVSGKGGPFNQADASATPFTAKVSVQHADVVATALVPPTAGISGFANLEADATSSGQAVHAQGTLEASQLKLAQKGTPAPKPVHLNFTLDQDLRALSGQVRNTTVSFDKAVFAIAGAYNTRGTATTLNLQVRGDNVPLNDLEAFLPSLGVQVPAGSRLQGGSLTTQLAVTGSSQSPVISGPLRINNTQLAGFDLGSKLSALNALTGVHTGNTTTIQVLSANIRSAGGALDAQNIVAVVPGVGAATGNGSVSPADALNFKLIAKIDQSGAGGVATQAISMLGGAAGGAAGGALRNGIPVSITGTSSHPVFTPDVKGLAGGALNPGGLLKGGLGKQLPQNPLGNGTQQNPVGNVLGGIFGKKPQ